MKNALLFVLLALSFQTKAQTVEASTTIPINDYLDLLAANLEIPEDISKKYENSSIDITFILTITKTGSVFNPKIQNDSLQLESNLKKAIEKLPKWNPKTEDGVAVVSRKAFNLSIFVPNNKLTKAVALTPQISKHFMRVFDVTKIIGNQSSNLNFTIEFYIEIDGSYSEFDITKSSNPEYNSKILNYFSSLPKLKEGIPEKRTKYFLPITIKIN